MRLKVSNQKTIWNYFYILYLILSSYSVYMVVFPIGTTVQLGAMAISVITMGLYLRDGILRKMFFFPLGILLLFTGASLFSTVDTYATLMIFARFCLIFYCVAILMRREIDIFRIIYRCLFFLMTFYFCCYILFDILAPELGLSYISLNIINLNGVNTKVIYENHFDIYIRWANSVQFFGVEIKRLCGFCWEAGQYQTYVNFVLMYLLFFDKHSKNKVFKILFTVLNVVLCGSSMGYLIAVVLFAVKMSLQKNKVLRILCFFPLLAVGGFAVLSIIQEKSVDGVYSFTNRTAELELMSDILFKNNPFGCENITSNNSNGLIRFLWAYGYLAVAAVVGIVVSILKNKGKILQIRQKFVFLLWLVLSLCNEPIEYFNITLLIVAFVIVDNLQFGKQANTVKSMGVCR